MKFFAAAIAAVAARHHIPAHRVQDVTFLQTLPDERAETISDSVQATQIRTLTSLPTKPPVPRLPRSPSTPLSGC